MKDEVNTICYDRMFIRFFDLFYQSKSFTTTSFAVPRLINAVITVVKKHTDAVLIPFVSELLSSCSIAERFYRILISNTAWKRSASTQSTSWVITFFVFVMAISTVYRNICQRILESHPAGICATGRQPYYQKVHTPKHLQLPRQWG